MLDILLFVLGCSSCFYVGYLIGFEKTVSMSVLIPVVVFAFFTIRIMALNLFLGRPVTIDKLKKRLYYELVGHPHNIGDSTQIVILRDEFFGGRGLIAVKLSFNLPEGADGFTIVPYYNEIRVKQKGKLEIIVSGYRNGEQIYEKLVVDLNPNKRNG